MSPILWNYQVKPFKNMCSLTGGQKGKSVKSCSNWFYKSKSLTTLASVRQSKGRCQPLLVGGVGAEPGWQLGRNQASAVPVFPALLGVGGTQLQTPGFGIPEERRGKSRVPSNLTSRPLADPQVSQGRTLLPRRFGSQRPYIYRIAALLDRHVLYICLGLFSRPTGKE